MCVNIQFNIANICYFLDVGVAFKVAKKPTHLGGL